MRPWRIGHKIAHKKEGKTIAYGMLSGHAPSLYTMLHCPFVIQTNVVIERVVKERTEKQTDRNTIVRLVSKSLKFHE